MTAQTIVDELNALLGSSSVLTAPGMIARYLSDQRELLHGKARAIVRPQTTEEISKIVTLARRLGFSIVPQAGNTSYCGGATPDESGHQVVMSFERHNKIRRIDPLGFTASVDSGLILDDLHKAIAEFNLSFGLSLGSQGSCQIGGNIATNAGGISVLRYGMMRDLVLGLEVVLPNGEIFEDMTRLRTIRDTTSSNYLSEAREHSDSSLVLFSNFTLSPPTWRRPGFNSACSRPSRRCWVWCDERPLIS
jgi:FAD/FMN-containing dehydrogenase